MSDIQTLDKVASNPYDQVTLVLLRRGVKDFPRSLYKRHDYYKNLFDKCRRSGRMSEDFKKNFSMFVSRSADLNVQLRHSDYVDD